MPDELKKLTTDASIVKKAKDDVLNAIRNESEWRRMAKESYDFYAGNQWDSDAAAKLKNEQRPVIVFNRVARIINAIMGLEVQNRQEVRYIPREMGDVGVNELLTGAADWVRDQSDAEDEESEAFLDCLICGVGATETRIDFEVDPDGKIFIDRIDPIEIIYDPDSKKRNFDDARWISRVKQLTKRELFERWPDKAENVGPSNIFADTDVAIQHEVLPDGYRDVGREDEFPSNKALFSVLQYQWWESETFYRVVSESGQIVELSAQKFKRLKARVESSGLRFVKQKRRVYHQAFVSGNVLLEKKRLPTNDFTIRTITGFRDRNHHRWLGVVELMKDPQRWNNKWLSQILHIVNSNAKGGLLAEVGAFVNPIRAEQDWARPDSVVMLNQGGLNKIQQKEPPSFPSELNNLLTYSLESISGVAGVSLEMLGQADRNQPGFLEAQRTRAGINNLAVFFDSLRRYRKEQGRVLAKYITEFISDGRLVRIAGDHGAQYVPLLKDKLSLEFDVIVDDAPSTPNMKERVFSTLTSILPMLLQSGVPIPP